jgi:hypothetical protein
MVFSPAQYQTVANKAQSGTAEMVAKLQQFPPAANKLLMYAPLPDPVKESIRYLTEQIISLLKSALDKVVELLKGVAAPVTMYFDQLDWQEIGGRASGLAKGLTGAAEELTQVWTGDASDAFNRTAGAQAAAAERISELAKKIAGMLESLVFAAMLFYAALALIIAKFIVGETAALVALATVVGAPIGLGIELEEVGVNTFLIVAAVQSLYQAINQGFQTAAALDAEAADPTSFPLGHWPKATGARYSATVR